MKASQTQSKEIKNCIHFKKLPISNQSSKFDHSFIKPNIKGWLCLYDGCCKKQGNTIVVKQQLSKYEQNHKIFMEMNKLQIFCFQCNIQITDEQQNKAYEIRKLAMEKDKQQQKMLYGANIEYPQGFQRQKAGLAGTVGTQLNSFINSAVQLMAHIPPFYHIIQEINLETIQNQLLRKVFEIVAKIRSGVYRIVQTKQIQQQLVKQNAQFKRYSYKTPSNFYYEILRIFSMEFLYQGPSCKSKQIMQMLPLNVMNHPQTDGKSNYSPMKQLFSGQFLWGVYCPQCTQEKTLKAEFQCIRLEDTSRTSQNSNAKLQQLIQSTFNLQKSFQSTFQQIICQKKQCKSKQIQLKLNKLKSQLKIPNILLFELGSNQQGLCVQCPDSISLSKFVKSNNNEQYLYQYVGSIGRTNKKYYTHIKQLRQDNIKQYIFDDVLIKEDNVQKPNKTKLVIYKMNPLSKNKILSKNVQSSLIVDVECVIPLPDFWNFYLSDLRFVQPLVNPFLCRHGLLKPQVKSKSKIAKKIPLAIYQYLVEQFGGINTNMSKQGHYCSTCTQKLYLLRQLKQSQKQMAKFADQLSSKKSRACIDIQWFEKWKKYLYNSQQISYQNQYYKRPGPINNKKGIQQNGQIDQTRYKKVSPEVWYFFKKFYGGGPLIAQNLAEPSLALVQAVDLRYDIIKNVINKLFQY